MQGPISLLPRPADADRHLAATAFSVGLGWVVLLALHPVPTIAQTWAQAAPSFNAKAENVTAAAPVPTPVVARRPKLADFKQTSASPEVQHIAHWVLDSGDNGGMPYMIVDKVNAEVFVFDAKGHLEGADPALLGMATGDRAAPGIENQRVSAIRPEDRVTPAGRFVASLAPDLQGQDILWIDYASALAMHRVVKGKADEGRAGRLLSATPRDNRISYGCINVPVAFFENVVSTVFSRSSGIVYILPETGPANEFFGSYDVAIEAQTGTSSR